MPVGTHGGVVGGGARGVLHVHPVSFGGPGHGVRRGRSLLGVWWVGMLHVGRDTPHHSWSRGDHHPLSSELHHVLLVVRVVGRRDHHGGVGAWSTE